MSTRRDDPHRLLSKPRQGVSRPPGVGKGRIGRNAKLGQTPDDVRDQVRFTAKQVGGTLYVENEPIGRIAGDDRRIEPQSPYGERLQRGLIAPSVGVHDYQVGEQGFRLGDGHADIDAKTPRKFIRGRNDAAPTVRALEG